MKNYRVHPTHWLISTQVPAGASGYCECHDGTRARESDCDHGIFTCGEACAVHLGLAYPDG